MKSTKTKKIFRIIGIILGIVAAAAIIFVISLKQLPVRVITEYPIGMLWEESETMHECAECHEPEEDFHTCSTCHDEHGSVELTDLSFYNMVELTGDVEEVIFIPWNHFFLNYSDLPNTFITVSEFMEKWEIPDYESFTLYSRDGSFIKISKENITDNAMFLPYEDGIRFASDDLHESTWAKGIARIIIIGEEKPLQIGEEKTSIGRLLLGKTTSITVEEAKVMFRSEDDGITREAYTSSRIEGAALSDLVDLDAYETMRFTVQDGNTVELPTADVREAVLTKQYGSVVLIIPDEGRSGWVFDIIKIEGMN